MTIDLDEEATRRTEIDGAKLLDNVLTYLRRFVQYPSEHAGIAHALWIAHAHCIDIGDSSPRIAFQSPEPGSGKSRALEVTAALVPNPVEAINVTPAYMFRKVSSDDGRPTILFDEIDTVFGPKAKENEEIRGFLNAGHRKHSVAGRCVVRGKEVFTEEIPAYCAVALAGVGGLPDTIRSRTVEIPMRRRRPDEVVEPYRRRRHEAEGFALRDRLAAWCSTFEAPSEIGWPEMPEGVVDRDADIWEILLFVADRAGGEWPQRARVTAATLVTQSKQGIPSLGVRLLTDLRAVFGSADKMSTDAILKALSALEESPWGDLRGRPIDARVLSRMLRPYDVRPTTIWFGDAQAKGYQRSDLHDPWQRYVPPSGADRSVTSVTSVATAPQRRADITHGTDVTHLPETAVEYRL